MVKKYHYVIAKQCFVPLTNIIINFVTKHKKLEKHGFNLVPKHVIGARPTSNRSKHNQDSPVRITYDSPETKKAIISAAMFGALWGRRNAKDKFAFFRDIPNVRRHVQLKRRRQEEPDEKEPKR